MCREAVAFFLLSDALFILFCPQVLLGLDLFSNFDIIAAKLVQNLVDQNFRRRPLFLLQCNQLAKEIDEDIRVFQRYCLKVLLDFIGVHRVDLKIVDVVDVLKKAHLHANHTK